MKAATLVWFRQDLRLRDNPALDAAVKRGGAVIPVYVWAPEEEGEWASGAASRWWLHHSLAALDASLRERGSRLTVARGRAAPTLLALAKQCGADAVYWNRRYEPAAIECSAGVEAALARRGVESRSFNSALLVEPHDLPNQSGKPYQVYTPFRQRVLRDVRPPRPLRAPPRLRAPEQWPKSTTLALLPTVKWYATMEQTWRPGEAGAQARLARFLKHGLPGYRAARDEMGTEGTSRLSPHLHFGEIGPRQIWHALGAQGRASTFLHELLWREFAHHLLVHFPHTTTQPLRAEFAHFPWKRNAKHLRAWQRGRTGIPLVDAGMHELWATGYMHNRVRMVTASFLVKNLMQPWQDGARWFWDTLVDADLANNTLNWQWVAGSGADAAPYFRIFNPLIQADRYDASGAYVRRWSPGPHPPSLVDLAKSRDAALEAYQAMRRRGR
jgi:deoxyribodipyrimidine photo-lyase